MSGNKKFAANMTILLVFISYISLSVVGGIILQFAEIDGIGAEIAFAVLTQVVCLGILPLTLFNILRKKGGAASRKNAEPFAEYISLSAPRGGVMPKILRITVCAMVISAAISVLTQVALSFLPTGGETAAEAEAIGLNALLLGLILGCVLPAIFEELTFRGILLGAYKDSPRAGVFLSAAMFALMHMNIDQTFYTFFIGIVLAVLTLKSRSIIPAMIIHFLNNAVNYVSAYLLSQIASAPVGQTAANPMIDMIGYIIVYVIIAAIVAAAVVGLTRALKKINRDNPVDWTEKSAEPGAWKTRFATAAAVFIGVIMTALTVFYRML